MCRRGGRRNGNLSLLVQPGVQMAEDGTTSTVGYPYGTVPRLLLTWLSTETLSRDRPLPPLANAKALVDSHIQQ